MAQAVDIFPSGEKDLFTLYSQYHDYWWPGGLTHWGQDNMADIMTFTCIFFNENFDFQIKFRWNTFLPDW